MNFIGYADQDFLDVKSDNETNILSLFTKDLFVDDQGKVNVPFPDLFKIVTGEDLELSPKVIDAYNHFDKSNPKNFIYEVSSNRINRMNTKEILDFIGDNKEQRIYMLKNKNFKEKLTNFVNGSKTSKQDILT